MVIRVRAGDPGGLEDRNYFHHNTDTFFAFSTIIPSSVERSVPKTISCKMALIKCLLGIHRAQCFCLTSNMININRYNLHKQDLFMVFSIFKECKESKDQNNSELLLQSSQG